MITIGLDLSINSTGVCINKDNTTFKYFIITSKLTKKQLVFKHRRLKLIGYNKQVSEGDYTEKEYIKTLNINKIVDEIDVVHGVTAHACPCGLEYNHDQQLDE